MTPIPCLSFVGRSGVGKTTVLERLVFELAHRGYRSAVVKHTRHQDVETDLVGKDTRRFWDAGAIQTILVTPDRVVHTRQVPNPTVTAALTSIRDVDLVLVEGDKFGPLPKIEVVRSVLTEELLDGVDGRIACVSDVMSPPWAYPTFPLDSCVPLVDYVEEWILAAKSAVGEWEEVEHTADSALRVSAPSLQELFVAAARGMFSLCAATTERSLTQVVTLTVEAPDRESLLIDWLNELLYLSTPAALQRAYLAFRFDAFTATALRATALGALVTEPRSAVKAATFHDLTIRDSGGGLETKLVFDI